MIRSDSITGFAGSKKMEAFREKNAFARAFLIF
jgi:hypothetical protein